MSLNGNRSNLGLEPPVGQCRPRCRERFGGFASLIFNATPSDQLRLITGSRRDFYQIPNTPGEEAAGIRDAEIETDTFAAFSWVHTFDPVSVLTIRPSITTIALITMAVPAIFPTTRRITISRNMGAGRLPTRP